MINKDTSNQSFIDMWRLLQTKGVENNSFMLELKDQSLKDFKLSDLKTDDRDKRSHLINKIMEECQNNIWFFFREVFKLPNKVAFFTSENPEVKFKKYDYILNETEMAMIYMYDNDINFLSYIDKNLPKGIQTTIYILEIYNMISRSNVKGIPNILLYNEDIDIIDIYKSLVITNGDIFNSSFMLDELNMSIDKYEIGINKPELPINELTRYFLHIKNLKINDNLLYKIYHILYNKSEITHLFGIYNSLIYSNDNNESDIMKNLVIKLLTEKIELSSDIYDNTKKYKNNKLYLI